MYVGVYNRHMKAKTKRERGNKKNHHLEPNNQIPD